jgi:hypothetical protein
LGIGETEKGRRRKAVGREQQEQRPRKQKAESSKQRTGQKARKIE